MSPRSPARRVAAVATAGLGLVLLGLPLAAGCDTACVDRDGDGLGEGCAAGPDCDDTNQARTDDCDRVPPADCARNLFATGCACTADTSGSCYEGPRDTVGRGPCALGFHECVGGRWGLCVGQTVPVSERCNELDDDCDGEVDEDVRSPCGGCTPGCVGGIWGREGEPFREDEGERVAVLDDGRATLALEQTASDALWVPNSGEATVSKLDTQRGVEVARYPSGAPEPSRVAVDYLGDAFVANRAFDGQGTVSRIAGEAGRCVDRDGDGRLRTSTGPTDVVADDECVLWDVPVGEPGDVPRALAIDGDRGLDGIAGGSPWVGLDVGQRVLRLDPLDGSVTAEVATPGFQPYGAAFDSRGVLWLVERAGHVARIDPSERPLRAELLEIPFACNLGYGLAVDRADRVLVTGFSCDSVYRYEPATGAWSEHAVEASPRGVVVGLDGDVWLAHTGALVSRLYAENLRAARVYDLVRERVLPSETVGIAVAGDAAIWAISEHSGDTELGLATRLTPADGPGLDVPLGRAPHAQGDLTGGALRAAFASEGRLRHVFTACGETVETRWERIHVAVDLVGSSTLAVRYRHAANRSALAAARWTDAGTLPDDAAPFELSLPVGGVLEVELVLAASDRSSAPRVTSIGVEWECPGPD